jgi:membrane protein YqaA with SNARE-associated domain
MSYLIVFFAGFAAATFLPIYSEAVFLFYLPKSDHPLLLTLAAAVGNTLGSLVNYYIGRLGEKYLRKKVDIRRLEQAERLFAKWGGWSLLLSWAPVIGDPLTFVAGLMRYDLKKFLILVFIAKFGRYLLLYLGYLGLKEA